MFFALGHDSGMCGVSLPKKMPGSCPKHVSDMFTDFVADVLGMCWACGAYEHGWVLLCCIFRSWFWHVAGMVWASFGHDLGFFQHSAMTDACVGSQNVIVLLDSSGDKSTPIVCLLES